MVDIKTLHIGDRVVFCGSPDSPHAFSGSRIVTDTGYTNGRGVDMVGLAKNSMSPTWYEDANDLELMDEA